VLDVGAACRTIAQDLDAPAADQAAAEGQADARTQMTEWCKLAVARITASVSASGSLTVQFTPPVCEASISAKANCQASCSAEGTCDIKANPPTCEGGKLEVACKGDCTASAGASVACEGSCEGECTGSCTAEGGVDCAGKCDGTCAAGAGGSGIQADGTCQGTCTGTCEVTAPSATCTGSCNGSCSATCKGSATASVKCDGTCTGEFEPLKCSGGELKGGCQVEAECDANCDASVKAKAECRPPALTIAVAAGGDAQIAGKLRATLEGNLGVILAFEARATALVGIAGSLSANVSGFAEVKAACLIPMGVAAAAALADLEASVSASGSVAGSVN
jgi:hypothetical protein